MLIYTRAGLIPLPLPSLQRLGAGGSISGLRFVRKLCIRRVLRKLSQFFVARIVFAVRTALLASIQDFSSRGRCKERYGTCTKCIRYSCVGKCFIVVNISPQAKPASYGGYECISFTARRTRQRDSCHPHAWINKPFPYLHSNNVGLYTPGGKPLTDWHCGRVSFQTSWEWRCLLVGFRRVNSHYIVL